MTKYWANDPELFLHSGKDGVVQLLRCHKNNETSSTTSSPSSSMLMKPEDFKQEGSPITDHLSLFGGYYEWDINKYKALIDYISPNHLMVNRLGSVIVEVATDNKEAPVVYIRGLDVLAMGSFGPPTRPLPARTVRYLLDGTIARTTTPPRPITTPGDVDGIIAKTKKVVENLQKELDKEKKEKRDLEERVVELEEVIKKSGADNKSPATVRIHTKADEDYTLTVQDGLLMLNPYIEEFDDDLYQYWVKDDKYGESVKDASGHPSFALVNKSTGLAMKHSIADINPVHLVPYNPYVVDKSILWSEDKLDDGYSAIRMANDISMNLGAFMNEDVNGAQGDEVIEDDGTSTTTTMLGKWLAEDIQKWKIVTYCKSAITLFPYSLSNTITSSDLKDFK